MWEVIPVVLGALLGLVAGGPGPTQVVRLVSGALAIGTLVALLSGELRESWAFALLDSGVALLAAVVARAAAAVAVGRRSDA